MKDIYASSALTIVAASAEEVSEGFLQDQPCTKDTFTIPFRIKPDLFGTFSFGRLDAAAYDERSEPLAKRTWTMQEQVLAQRTVVFATHTMIWACKAGTKTFSDSIHYPYYDSMDTYQSLNLNKLILYEQEARDCLSDTLSCWCRLISAYSLRFASLEKDKLNAIAGVASLPSFASALGLGYFAGMWSYKFALQLTWYVDKQDRSLADGERRTSHRLKIYRAPSWSWASVEGGVIRFTDIFAPIFSPIIICEVLECSTTPRLDGNPLGEIVSARLKLRSTLRTAWFYPETSNLVLLPALDGEVKDDMIVSHQEAYKQHIKDFVAEYPKFDLDETPEVLHGTWNDNTMATSDESNLNKPMVVCCLAIASEFGEGKSVSGLLLADTGEGSYTRIGQFMRGKKKDFAKKDMPRERIILV